LPYRITFSPRSQENLRGLPARLRAIVIDAVAEQLQHQPTVETRNRKALRPNPLAARELRIGNLRVFYDVLEEPEPTVEIRAIGVKVRNRVYIGEEVFEP
jgi:mRNA-degrading endonuclease RelE of RelBE toxin-antitoxin system